MGVFFFTTSKSICNFCKNSIAIQAPKTRTPSMLVSLKPADILTKLQLIFLAVMLTGCGHMQSKAYQTSLEGYVGQLKSVVMEDYGEESTLSSKADFIKTSQQLKSSNTPEILDAATQILSYHHSYKSI